MLTDTHCHLDFENFDDDRIQVVDRALEVGVGRILNPGINLFTSSKAVELSKQFPEVFVAAGVHPNDAISWQKNTIEDLRRLTRQPKVVAIGEIGLDFYRDRAPHDLQTRIFREQLALAAEIHKPVVIHTRNASPSDEKAITNTLEILAEWIGELRKTNSEIVDAPGVLHSFSSDYKNAIKAIEMKFMIGITGPVTYPNADELRDVAKNVDLNFLMIETDAPFLTPQQHRGKRNEPANVKFVAEKIAEIRNLPYDVIVKKTWLNSKRMFNW